MKLSLKKDGVLEPKWNGNLSLPGSERIRLTFKWPEYGYENNLEKGEMTADGQLTGRGLKTFVAQVVSQYVTKVEGIETDDGPIQDGKALSTMPNWVGEEGNTWDLLMEIALHITAGQGEISAKKKTSEELTG